ncbi:hypothetical protein B0H15DRAFT_910485 [Mycena belliarum]|uniref:DUF6534 domain-containing protein n=1 Tax=Mycena belliarum TaxID=1033014 RepID=A0AAD6XSY1_9AGAR|nr:hypothetical protein B0H15DRAFT_910485 [Mycena belliae]
MSSPPPGPPPGPPPNIGAITAPTLLGSLLNFFLFGTLLIQVCAYHVCFPNDMPAIKRLVYSIFASMALCTCLNAADAYYWFGAGFGDLARLAEPRFSAFYTPMMGSIIALAVQLFYCYRISVFRRHTEWLVPPIVVAALVQAAGGMGGGLKAYIAANGDHDHARIVLVYMWLAGDAVADILIAGSMTYLLSQASEPHTRYLVRGVMRLIVETNAFSASVAIVGLILFAGVPNSTYFICPTLILPGLYANTLLLLLLNRALPPSARAPRSVRSGSATHVDRPGAGSVLDIRADAPHERLEPFAAAPGPGPGRGRGGTTTWQSATLDMDTEMDYDDRVRGADSKWM